MGQSRIPLRGYEVKDEVELDRVLSMNCLAIYNTTCGYAKAILREIMWNIWYLLTTICQVLSIFPCQTTSAHMFSYIWQLSNRRVVDMCLSHACPFYNRS